MICEKCGAEVTQQTKLASRTHGSLSTWLHLCAHIWFLKVLPSSGLVLDMTLRDIRARCTLKPTETADPGMTPLKKFSIMTEDDYDATVQQEYGAT